MSVGKRIKDCRLKKKMSVDELAEKLQKNRATIYRYENGDIEKLPVTMLEPIAKILDTTPAFLMGWVDLDFVQADGETIMSRNISDEERIAEVLRPLLKEVGYSIAAHTSYDNGKLENLEFSLENEEHQMLYFSYEQIKTLCDSLKSYSKFQISELLKSACECSYEEKKRLNGNK